MNKQKEKSNWCPMCDEYEISDDYVVMKKTNLSKEYIKKDKIEALIEDIKKLENISLEYLLAKSDIIRMIRKSLLGESKDV